MLHSGYLHYLFWKKPSKNLFRFLVLFPLLYHNSSFAQSSDKWFFETEFITKFSFGQEVREDFQYEPGFMINYPSTSTFEQPQFTLLCTPGLNLSNHLAAGISTGIGIQLYEPSPLSASAYAHRIMFPLYGRIAYSVYTKSWAIIPEGKLGYQFSNTGFGWTDEGFLYEVTGGFLAGLGLRFAKNISKYTLSLSMGYELNQYKSNVSLGWVPGYDYTDQYTFNTNYHFLWVGAGIKLK